MSTLKPNHVEGGMMYWVDKYYEMNPTFDLYCPTGFHLQRDWIVLIEDFSHREDTDNEARWSANSHEQARRWNRWGKIVETRLGSDGQLYVTMCYDGNVVKQVSCNPNQAWLVKKDSVEFPEISAPQGIITND